MFDRTDKSPAENIDGHTEFGRLET
jgi:hypothetical protein